MTTTAWPQVVDALVAVMRATTGYQAPGATGSGIPVYDGPEMLLSEDRPSVLLVVGWSGDSANLDEPGSAGESSTVMAATTRPKDEDGKVACRAIAQIGDGEIGGPKSARDLAFAVVDDVRAALRVGASAPTLGVSTVRWAQITEHRMSQWLNRGPVCQVDFTVSYKARI